VFPGFANFYRRFVKNFSKIVAPITRLLKKDVEFRWDDAAKKAFNELKTTFASEPTLVHFNPDKPCTLETDASKSAIGAVCSQPDDKGVLHPVAYYSRSLNPPERNYHVHDSELLAVVEGLEQWRHYFAYSKFPVTILTDHKNLEYFTEKRALNERQIRWSERLSKFKIDLVYRPGSKNGAADALSRMYPSEGGEGNLPHALLPEFKTISVNTIAEASSAPLQRESDITSRIKKGYLEDWDTKALMSDLARDPDSHPNYSVEDGLLFFKGLIFVPHSNEIKRDILVQCHDEPMSGHFGVQKTFELVNRTYHWPGVRQFVKRFVTTCDTCQRNKYSRHKPFGLLQPLPVPDTPWSSISMDFITQLPTSAGFTSIFVVVDRLTKMAHFAPSHDNVDAAGVVSLLMDQVVTAHGLPDDIVSDRGPVFTAQFTRAFMEALNVKQNLSTAFHPQSDGQTERTNATLEQYLRCFINYQQDNWSQLLPLAQFCYNNTVHSSTNQTPFFALYGYHPRFNVHIPRVQKNTPEAKERLAVLKRTQEDLKFHIESAQESQARFHDQNAQPAPNFAPGDLVWLVRKHIRTARPSSKLDSTKLGPFKIVGPVGSRAFRLNLPQSMRRVHPVFHVSLLEPHLNNDIDGRVAPPPPPIEVTGDVEWEVEAILDSKMIRGRLKYFVDWKGFPPSERSWEPLQNLEHCPELLDAYHQRYPDKPGPERSLPVVRS